MTIIGISGAQGAGKTTLLKGLEDLGYSVDPFKVSRAVQEKLGGLTLIEAIATPKLMVDFQEEVFSLKYHNDKNLSSAGKLILVERTFADIWTYASMWTWAFVDKDRWSIDEAVSFISGFTVKCRSAQREIYSGIIMVPLMDHVIWENDPNRATLESAKEMYENLDCFVHFKPEQNNIKLMTITSGSIQNRISEAQDFLNTFL